MDFERAKVIYAEALGIDSPEDRSAYLERSCVADPKVRAMIESFLEAQGRMVGFLARISHR